MFSMEELLSKRNIRDAFAHFENKKNSKGLDGMKLDELQSYWQINEEHIRKQLFDCTYVPGLVLSYDIVSNTGKKRTISTFNVIDRFITRLLAQKMKRYIDPVFLEKSYAYQENKGVVEAVKKVKEYIKSGNRLVAEIDLKDYFDSIDLENLNILINERIDDKRVVSLINSYLYVMVMENNRTYKKQKGIIQGSSISPVLSNLYLHSLDLWLEEKQYNWIRFADNIYVYGKNKTQLNDIFQNIICWVSENRGLKINLSKSGIYDVFFRRILGYEFYMLNGEIDCRKYQYKPMKYYGHWVESAVSKMNNQYHILENGVLNKKDYSLLFENEEKKYHIPIEVIEQMNFYNDVIISPNVFKILAQRGIKVAFFDKYQNLLNYFIPEKIYKPADLTLKQSGIFLNENKNLVLAKKFQNASIHQMKAVLKYYLRRKKVSEMLEIVVKELNKALQEVNEAKMPNQLMLIEARARQRYYACFNEIINEKDFRYVKRTKRPPKDALNAMISFGNTILYHRILSMIWKVGLDPRFGIVHTSKHRAFSLNLDFADYFKPIIVDRLIFNLINTHQIKIKEHFQCMDFGGACGVYLNDDGKRIFLKSFEQKMKTKLIIKGDTTRYEQLIQKDIYQFKEFLQTGKSITLYKYY